VVARDGRLGLAVAQVGGINLSDSRSAVVARLVEMMREAKARGASVVVYPELTLTTFFPRHWIEDESELDRFFETQMPNEHVQPLFDCANELEVGFYLGYAELTPDQRRFNTSILVDPDGRIAGKYRKVHLPGHADHRPEEPTQHLEKRYFEVGDLGFGVFDLMQCNVGMCICNDRRWSEVYRVLALQSADLVLVGYNTPSRVPGWKEQPHGWMFTHLLSLQAGAYQNSVWVAAAAKCGVEDGAHMIGGSAIVAPSGEIVARAVTEDDEVVVAEVDLAMAEPYRQSVFNFAAHRRPENYRLIVERVGRGEPLPVHGHVPEQLLSAGLVGEGDGARR
jgi:N-carbamoyl-D-amino-acid hydrolase